MEISASAELGSRALFPLLGQSIYLNHAAISPPSLKVREAVVRIVDDFALRGSAAFLDAVEARSILKCQLADLLGAPSADGSDFAWCPNTTSGVQAIAHAFPWQSGDSILLFRGEFPTNIIPWQQAAQRAHLTIKWASLERLHLSGGVDWSEVETALKTGIRLVAISAVQFQTGLRVPLHELSLLCKRYGAALFVDGIQACGATPIPLYEIDFMACGGHKWMMGVEGSGFLYIHPRWHQGLQPPHAGWLSVEDPLDFLFADRSALRYDKRIRVEPSSFEGGAQSALCYAALGASVDLLQSLGIPSIYDHIQSLLDLLERGLLERGFQSARCKDVARRSTILSVTPPLSKQKEISEWVAYLAAQGVVISQPDGWLRFSPHWSNDQEQIRYTLDLLSC